MDGFRFATELDVRFSETDAQGVVHHAVYAEWLEVARIAYIEQYPGGYKGLVESGVDVTTTEVYVRYLLPAAFGDRLKIHVRAKDVRGARFRFDYVIARDGSVVAEGWTTHACIDATTLRPTRIPEGLRAKIEEIEG